MAAAVILTLSACSQNLVFDNEYDPDADNSPLGTSVSGVYSFGYLDATNGKTVEFGWDRIPNALSYEYEVAQMYGKETPEEAFQDPERFIFGGTVAQPAEGDLPQSIESIQDGEYAIRVRYEATATHNGVTNPVWSPWSAPQARGVGVPLYYYATTNLQRGEWFADDLAHRGDRFVFIIDAEAGTAGNTVFLSVRDEFSGYPNGADVEIAVYDAESSFDGPLFTDSFMYDKESEPITFNMPTSERVFIMFESYNDDVTDFEIRVDY